VENSNAFWRYNEKRENLTGNKTVSAATTAAAVA
jgi:hypothetical protein